MAGFAPAIFLPSPLPDYGAVMLYRADSA